MFILLVARVVVAIVAGMAYHAGKDFSVGGAPILRKT